MCSTKHLHFTLLTHRTLALCAPLALPLLYHSTKSLRNLRSLCTLIVCYMWVLCTLVSQYWIALYLDHNVACAAYVAFLADVPWSYRSLLPSFSLPVRAAIIRPNLKPESKKFSGPDWLIDWRHQSCHQLMGWELENKASKFNVGRAMSEDIFRMCLCSAHRQTVWQNLKDKSDLHLGKRSNFFQTLPSLSQTGLTK